MSFFSIIIPAYNRARLLPETLASLRAQTFTDWECFVVDDGSTDETESVMQALCAQDARIRYVYQPNAERSAARNKGIDHANGQYICFLDSDDRYTPEYLKELHQFLTEMSLPEALIVTNFCLWDGEKAEPVNVPPFSGNPAEWLFRYPVSPSRACVHREVLTKYRFREDIVIVEDTVLWVSLANEFPVLHLDKPLVWYRVHEGNSVNKLNNSGLKRLHGLCLFFRDPLSGQLSKSFKREMLSDCYFGIGQFYFYKGNKGPAFRNLWQSVFLMPLQPQTKAKIFLMFCLIPGFERIWSHTMRVKKITP